MNVLQASNISIKFGGLVAVSNFSLSVKKGDIIAIIGPNGAGKTTVFNLLTGIYAPTAGKIYINGTDVTGQKTHEIGRAGIARTFQNIRLFSDISVLDNLLIAQTLKNKYSLWAALVRNKKFFRVETEMIDKAMEILKVFRLDGKAGALAKNLPYGEQRRLEIARAIMTEPEVLLLDEPCAGMVSGEINEIIQLVPEIRDRFHLSVLLIEHHMSIVMSIAELIKVLDFGKTIAEGTPEEIKNNPAVITAYLGGDFANAEG